MVRVIGRLLSLMTGGGPGARRDAACALAVELINIALGVAAPVLLKACVDALTTDAPASGAAALFIAGFVIAWAGGNAAGGVKLVFTMRIIDGLLRRLVLDAARAQLPRLARGDEGDSARLLGVLERLPYSLQIVIDGIVWRAAPLALQIAISLAVLAALVPAQYMAMLALTLGAYALATRLGAGQFQKAAGDANEAAACQGQTLGDILRNARRVVFNGNIPGELEIAAGCIGERRSANERLSRLVAATALAQFAVLAAGLGTVLTVCANDVAAGTLTPGDFVLLQAYAFRLALPLGGFGFILRQAGAAIANIAETISFIVPAGDKPQRPGPAQTGPKEIVLDKVGHKTGDNWIFRNASARIPPGTFAVMVGPNGSGKSTLARIIAGLIAPHEGAVRVDGEPPTSTGPEERSRLALYAPQTIGLFNRTLRENALYPPTQLTEADLAALLADWRFYQTGTHAIDLDLPLGEQGGRISGGQIQKLELARLAGVPAPILILDETTSALDQTSEERAIETLRQRRPKDATLILITHRLHMARKADLVLFLDGGRLTVGKHDELLRDSMPYDRFCSAQSPSHSARGTY
ncbi:ATP-binding cassette domain-containing protein [Hyphococcus sp.]|uniref:ATP-binding cassette domain-containing protein n=1 Tax=Hyphococcus sp. TaxID=2038636 RepID=UPI0035C6CC74